MQDDVFKSVESKKEKQLQERPMHDVHVSATTNIPDTAWERREKPSEEELEAGPWKPYVWCRNDEPTSGRQVTMGALEKKGGISKVFNSLATHNGIIDPQVIGNSKIQIDIAKHSVSGRGGGE